MAKNVNSGACLTIDLAALKQNYQALTEKLFSAKLAAVVKANAYGLGVKEIATNQIVQTFGYITEAREGVRKYSLGSGFNGWTPEYILSKSVVLGDD